MMNHYYGGSDLGASCGKWGTVFRVWSPAAEKIILNLYPDGDDGEKLKSARMEKIEDDVWVWVSNKNLDGVYYDFDIEIDGKSSRTADPYAKACGINGVRSMVIDLKRTNPEGWEQEQAPERGTEDIIYELHVKEFSWEKSSGVPKIYRGKYKAFTCKDTTLDGDGEKPTGLSYLKDLGVNYVQLMPVYDYGSVDEAGDDIQFNWGYDPVNYNVPEGSYATDAAHGEVRIRELKEMIQSLHEAGFRVIMDVVYNHTYSLESNLQKTVPGYYYRQNADGTYANGSACGNDVASERPMCGKYILDSVLYWAEEYHMDGFRFDLMGLLDVELMNRIQEELDRRYGVGEKLIYGEPWAAGASPMEKGSIPALKSNVRLLNKNIGIFCDSTRDAIKGHVFEEKEPGFVNGGANMEEKILNSVCAWCTENEEFRPQAPSQILSYISAHDNLTLWDKLIKTMPAGDLIKANKLAAAIYFTCQGRIFMLSGEEFGRTKDGLENSYNAPVGINRIDWKRAYEKEELREYYKGLIALRKELPGLCDKSEEAPGRITNRKTESKGCVSFCVDNTAKTGESRWNQLVVVYNSSSQTREISLPEGRWNVLLDGESSTKWKLTEHLEDTAFVLPGTAMILGK